jgi:malate dehydrogenase (oxaloacetate-decarboxylating)
MINDDDEPMQPLEVTLTGHALLDNPLLNKGTAFLENERREFGLLGLLPPHVATAEEQLARTYGNYQRKENDLERYIFLVSMQDRNETLFYMLLQEHITEMMPIIYTPVVGLGCQMYSRIYRRPRGLYVSYSQIDDIDRILANAPNPRTEVIVATDGERILGLGDLGVGGIGIPVGKLALYTLCAGVPPASTLPIILDVGTDNAQLLDDPLYLGWRHERVRGAEYDRFIEAFIEAVNRRFPRVLFQWEDFAKQNATRLLERYRDRLCSFNDDIQGTGAVALAGLISASRVVGNTIGDQRVVMFGAGSSATGISHQIVAAMTSEGLDEDAARRRLWLVDRKGVVTRTTAGSETGKIRYARPDDEVATWQIEQPGPTTLFDVIRNVRPTVLIGTSAQPGSFDERSIREMASHVARPIIFPLSNPTSKSEAVPADLLRWTGGRALVATGSPFDPITIGEKEIRIGQCNNAFIFPGVGLGIVATKARRVTDSMFVAAAKALSTFSPALREPGGSLFPALENVREISRAVALAVSREAIRSGLAEEIPDHELQHLISRKMWMPRYVPYVRPSRRSAQ